MKGEEGRRPKPLGSHQSPRPWYPADSTARQACDNAWGLEPGWQLSTAGQAFQHLGRAFLVSQPPSQSSHPFVSNWFLALTVLICDFIFPEWGELLRAGLLANWSGPIFLLPGPFAPLQEGSRWVCLPSLHLALHPRLRGACRTGAGHAGQPASSKAFIAVIWESRLPTLFPCQSVRETKHLERLKTFKRRKSKHIA